MSLEVSKFHLGSPQMKPRLVAVMETEAGEASDFQEHRLVPLAGFTRQPFLFRENASFHMFPETGSSGQGLLPKTSAISHMDRWEFCFFRLCWESFEVSSLEGCAFGRHGAGLQESTVDSPLKVCLLFFPDTFTATPHLTSASLVIQAVKNLPAI